MEELNSDLGKQSHWSWYIIPTNKNSRQFGDAFKLTFQEATAYLSDRTLRDHYVRFMSRVVKRLDDGIPPRALLMSDVDVRKTYESAVLFKRVALEENAHLVTGVTEAVIQRLQGYVHKKEPFALFANIIKKAK